MILAATFMVIVSLAAGCSGGNEWTTERIDGLVQASPEAAEVYQAAKASYPEDYRRFLESAVEAARENGQWTIEGNARRFTQLLMASHYDGLARAPDAQLLEIARQHVELLHALRRANVLTCTQYLRTGRLPEMDAPEAAVTIKNRIDALMLRAAASGEHGSGMARAELTSQERQSLMGAAAGRSPEAAEGLADPGGLHTTSEQHCGGGTAIFETIAGLQPDMAAKAIVSLLRPPPASGGATGR
jgi:hypothetical protein